MSASNVDASPSRPPPIPQFLNKLLAMVDDPATDKFIKWADDGNSFYVFNPDQFAKELLGTYYKTDASASFVRQLNMYGFHKVPHVRQGALKSDRQAQAWHYQNPKFKRGRPDLLPFIARKGKPIGSSAQHQHNNLALQPIKQADIENDIELLSGPINDDMVTQSASAGELTKGNTQNIDMTQIINGLATIKRHQTLISDNLKELQTSNQALWQEAMDARERHRKHQETINRILKFLASLFQGSSNSPVRAGGGVARNDNSGAVVPRAMLLIKDAPEREEDKESSTNSPKSTRMEEVDTADEELRSHSAATKPTDVETPVSTPTANKPRPESNPFSYSQSGVATPNANGYPFRDQGHYLANGTYIPPTDIYKILQWLQQNQIPIPGVYTPPTADPQALTTVPAGGHYNPMDFINAQQQNANAMSTNPQANIWPTYGPPVVQNQTTPAMPNSLYQTGNQLFNNLLPLASVATEPAPAANMAEVSRNADSLEQLSSNVEAMQQGIDSLIAGMGLDPSAAATLQNDNINSNSLITPSGTDPNQYGGPSAGTNGFINQAQNTDMGSYQPTQQDFDLDSLLKQLGVAAAANTPPATHPNLAEDFTTGHDPSAFTNPLNSAFDSSFFNDMNMYNQNNDTSYFSTEGTNNANAPQPSGYLNEIATSPVITRDDSAEPSFGDGPTDNGRGTPGARGRVKKRKNDSVSDDAGIGPVRRQSRSSGRNAKRRK